MATTCTEDGHKRLPKQALQYKPKRRRNIGRPRKRCRDQLHLEDQGTENTPNPSGTTMWVTVTIGEKKKEKTRKIFDGTWQGNTNKLNFVLLL